MGIIQDSMRDLVRFGQWTEPLTAWELGIRMGFSPFRLPKLDDNALGIIEYEAYELGCVAYCNWDTYFPAFIAMGKYPVFGMTTRFCAPTN